MWLYFFIIVLHENSVENNCGAEWVRQEYSKQEMSYIILFPFLLIEERGGDTLTRLLYCGPFALFIFLYSIHFMSLNIAILLVSCLKGEIIVLVYLSQTPAQCMLGQSPASLWP